MQKHFPPHHIVIFLQHNPFCFIWEINSVKHFWVNKPSQEMRRTFASDTKYLSLDSEPASVGPKSCNRAPSQFQKGKVQNLLNPQFVFILTLSNSKMLNKMFVLYFTINLYFSTYIVWCLKRCWWRAGVWIRPLRIFVIRIWSVRIRTGWHPGTKPEKNIN